MPLTPYVSHMTCEYTNSSTSSTFVQQQYRGSILCDAPVARTSPVFAMKYSTSQSYKHFVAMGDEDGFVSIVNTNIEQPSCLSDHESPRRPVAQWRAHKNAVFDLSWADCDRMMYTGAGDSRVHLWDTGYAKKIATLASGSVMSVKALAVMPDSSMVVASAGRDGNIHLFDARLRRSGPVMTLFGSHVDSESFYSSTYGSQGASVTSLCFLKGPHSSIVASGAQNGDVKLWDIRYDCNPVVTHGEPLVDRDRSLVEAISDANRDRSIHHVASMRQQQSIGQRSRGVTSLSLHPDGTQLLASYIGGHHLLFDVSHPEAGPMQWFGGNKIDSFYVKSAFSPDGSHFISGSSDNNVYIWSLKDRQGTNPIVLEGHTKEVTCVAWNPDNMFQAVSAGDDHIVKVWGVDIPQEDEERHLFNPYEILQERLHGQSPQCATPLWISSHVCTLESSTPPSRQPRSSIKALKISNALWKSKTASVEGKKRRKKQMTISQLLRNSKTSVGSKVNQRRITMMHTSKDQEKGERDSIQ